MFCALCRCGSEFSNESALNHEAVNFVKNDARAHYGRKDYHIAGSDILLHVHHARRAENTGFPLAKRCNLAPQQF
jgi:hypothetical protein